MPELEEQPGVDGPEGYPEEFPAEEGAAPEEVFPEPEPYVEPPPQFILLAPDYDPANPDHVLRWEKAGRPNPEELDGDGNRWKPTVRAELQEDGSYAPILLDPPAPVTDVDIARNYANAYQAAQDIIFLLMGRVAPALVIGKHFTEETVNKEGSRFTRYHKDEIEAFKLAGRHPDAGDALYEAVAASADEFPWLRANGGTILNIFATTLPRNSK